MDRKNKFNIPQEARRDIAWWGKFLEQYNGISIMWLTKDPKVDHLIASDACLTGFRAVCGTEYVHGKFPEGTKKTNIAHLEILAVLIALRTWASKVRGTYFWIHVDNEAVATVLNTGASREEFLQQALREILMLAAKNEFMIMAKHIRGVDNRIPDWLSRWHEPEARKKFRQYSREKSMKHIKISPETAQLFNIW